MDSKRLPDVLPGDNATTTQVALKPVGVDIATVRHDRNPAAVYLARLAPGSRRTMQAALDLIARVLSGGRIAAEVFPWADLRYQHTQAVRATLAQRYAPATVNKMLAALRGVLKECWRLGLMGAEEYQRAADLEPVRGHTLPRGRALAAEEMKALFSACAADPTAAGARDAALLAVLYGGGLRRSEVVALDLGDYDPSTGALAVREGKGHKDRISYVAAGAADALAEWVRVRGGKPGPLFCPVLRDGEVIARTITAQAIYLILQKRAQQAGVDHLSPHDLRRSFVSDLFDAGADAASVQRLAGHANINTTASYDRRGEAAKRQAAGLLHIPYYGGRQRAAPGEDDKS